MKQRKFKKLSALALTACCAFFASSFSGCGLIEEDGKTAMYSSTCDYSQLYSGQYYVWHDEKEKDVSKDIDCNTSKFDNYKYNVFSPVYMESCTFEGNETDVLPTGDPNRVVWMLDDNEDKIPTFYSGDELLYYSADVVPESFTIERFYDLGYTVGFKGLSEYGSSDYSSNKYCLNFGSDSVVIKAGTDAEELAALSENYTNVIINSIGGQELTKSNISKAGTITGMKKNRPYNIEVYTGTVRTTYGMTANVRTFYSMESFTTNTYEFVGSNVIKIQLPKYLKTGYYCINGIGLFRYVNGTSYDKSTDFNEPIIELDSDGQIVYNPADDVTEEEENSETTITSSDSVLSDSKEITVAEGEKVSASLTYSGAKDSDRLMVAPSIQYYLKEDTDASTTINADGTTDAATDTTNEATTDDVSTAQGTKNNPYVLLATDGKIKQKIVDLAPGTWVFDIYDLDNYQKKSVKIKIVKE